VDNHHQPTERYPLNPNGSPLGLTALTTTTGRVTIMMPHPERVFRSACMSWAPTSWAKTAVDETLLQRTCLGRVVVYSEPPMNEFAASGWTVTKTSITPAVIEDLRATAFSADGPGQRCRVDRPAVRDAALSLRRELIDVGFLPSSAVALQAIAFDENPTTNWKVTWHQDVMFPFPNP